MDSKFLHIDQAIRRGDHEFARKQLFGIRPSDVSREDLVTLSDFGVRIKMPLYSLKILGKIVRSHIEFESQIRAEEIISYSKALIKYGFFVEGERWVNRLDPNEHPQVNDLIGRMAMSQWNYKKAVTYHRRFRKTLNSESYAYLVSSLNLASSLVGTESYDEAIEILNELIFKATKGEHRIILANSFELMGQCYIFSSRFKDGLNWILLSQENLDSSKSVYQFYNKKWHFLVDLYSGVETKKILQRYIALKEDAQASHFWEESRELDRFFAKANRDLHLATKLFFGTTHRHYKEKIRSDFFNQERIPDRFLWFIGPRGQSEYRDFQMEKLPEKLDQFYSCLTSDFYRPLSLGHVFSRLYPAEYFNPVSSPKRVYNLVKRLREYLGPGMEINWGAEGISLTSTLSYRIPVNSGHHPTVSGSLKRGRELRRLMKRNWFTSTQAARSLELSQRSCQRLINSLENSYKVDRKGQGRSVRYRFAG